MIELALFAGHGGGVLGSQILGWRTAGYVEIDDYCQRGLRQRIKDGLIHDAPIYSDIRAFLDQGYARRYRGLVDVVTGGFPCQGHSLVGERKADRDDRDLWPETFQTICEARPGWAFLENVVGLLSSKHDVCGTFFGAILRDLATAGYDAEWCVLGADDAGADHRRKRVWILAHSESAERERRERREHEAGRQGFADGSAMADADSAGRQQESGSTHGHEGTDERRTSIQTDIVAGDGQGNRSGDVANSIQPGLEGYAGNGDAGPEPRRIGAGTDGPAGSGSLRQGAVADADSERFDGSRQSDGQTDQRWQTLVHGSQGWWGIDPAERPTESGLDGMADGLAAGVDIPRTAFKIPNRVARIKAIGNGQVPQTMAAAFLELRRRFE